jgi:hypothetical protein
VVAYLFGKFCIHVHHVVFHCCILHEIRTDQDVIEHFPEFHHLDRIVLEQALVVTRPAGIGDLRSHPDLGVAGGPLRGGVYKCALQSVDDAIASGVYGSWTPPAAEVARLKEIFPTGISRGKTRIGVRSDQPPWTSLL